MQTQFLKFAPHVLSLVLMLLSFQVFTQSKQRLPCVKQTFQLVLHEFLNDQGNPSVPLTGLYLSVTRLNQHFEPICIQFEICEVVQHPNYRYTEFNTDSDATEIAVLYNQPNRINLFAVSEISNNSALCGYTTPAGLTDPSNSIIVLPVTQSCNIDLIDRLTHEMGVYFGLNKTFEPSGELANGSNCAIAGDAVCDTPADPYVLGAKLQNYISNCVFIGNQQDVNGDFYLPDVGNVMSYYGCDCNFTSQQYQKMVDLYQANKSIW